MAVIKCPLMDKEVEKFDCNNSSIEEQVKDSYFITLLKQAYGHQLIIDGQTVGYYMLYFKSIKPNDIENIMQEQYESNMVDYYMAMHIRYLAIDKNRQHKGIGTKVLQGILAEIMNLSKKYPIRIVTIDALEQYYKWYKNIGFRDIPGCESDGIVHRMYMDCMTEKENECLKEFCDRYN